MGAQELAILPPDPVATYEEWSVETAIRHLYRPLIAPGFEWPPAGMRGFYSRAFRATYPAKIKVRRG